MTFHPQNGTSTVCLDLLCGSCNISDIDSNLLTWDCCPIIQHDERDTGLSGKICCPHQICNAWTEIRRYMRKTQRCISFCHILNVFVVRWTLVATLACTNILHICESGLSGCIGVSWPGVLTCCRGNQRQIGPFLRIISTAFLHLLHSCIKVGSNLFSIAKSRKICQQGKIRRRGYQACNEDVQCRWRFHLH